MKTQPGDHWPGSPIFRSAAVYWAIVFGIGVVLGSVRVPFLVPRIGERAAELAEMPLMFMAIYLTAGYIVRSYGTSVRPNGWIMVGLAALGLLICAELLLAVVMAGRGISDYISSRDPVSGSIYLVMLAVFAVMPWLRRRHGIKQPGQAVS